MVGSFMREKCGIGGVIDLRSDRNVLPFAKIIARSLQHRGELGAGMAWVRDGCIEVLKDNGLVRKVLDGRKLRHKHSSSAVVHTRYATSGSRDPELSQPFSSDAFAFGFNGNIPNFPLVAAEFFRQGRPLEFEVDTDAIRRYMIDSMQEDTRSSMRSAFEAMHQKLDGALSMSAVARNGDLFAYRQSPGIRPLVYGEVDGFLAVASEDSAILSAWPNARLHDLDPGSMLYADKATGEWGIEQISSAQDRSHCFFEWIYFARYLSTLDEASVREVRQKLGSRLAALDENLISQIDAVVPVPESALLAADGYAHESGVPIVSAIRSNKKGRTFTEGDRHERKRKSVDKYTLLRRNQIEGKNIIVIDDSIVRGTTMTQLIERVHRELRPAQIHLRIACPPILSPCFYGIDFSTFEELLARHHYDRSLPGGYLPDAILDDIAKELGVDSLRFVSLEDVSQAIGKPMNQLCTACISGEYPTPTGVRLHQAMLDAR